MSEGDFFSDEAKRASKASVQSAEAQTSAEIVVAVRKSSGRYSVLAYHFGLGACRAGRVVFAARTRDIQYRNDRPRRHAGIRLGFVAGRQSRHAVACAVARLDARRQRRKWRARNIFHLGISRTAARNGLLVYASMFERRCVVLTDIGIDAAQLGPRWAGSQRDLAAAVKRRDLPAFQHAIAGLGVVLRDVHPRGADDKAELATKSE